jgi:hypothetical protein
MSATPLWGGLTQALGRSGRLMANGKVRSWLGTTADIVGIAGISVTTVLAAVYSGKLNIDNIFKLLIFGAIFLAVAAFISALFFALAERIRSAPHQNNGYKTSLVVALWLAFISGAALFAYWGLSEIGSMKFIS